MALLRSGQVISVSRRAVGACGHLPDLDARPCPAAGRHGAARMAVISELRALDSMPGADLPRPDHGDPLPMLVAARLAWPTIRRRLPGGRADRIAAFSIARQHRQMIRANLLAGAMAPIRGLRVGSLSGREPGFPPSRPLRRMIRMAPMASRRIGGRGRRAAPRLRQDGPPRTGARTVAHGAAPAFGSGPAPVFSQCSTTRRIDCIARA